MKWREQWTWIYSWELKTNGPRTVLIILQSSTRCCYMLPLKDEKRQNESSAEVAGSIFPSQNLEVVPAIQLVQPETSREELLDIYLEVYKLHRLPSSPPGELAILEEVSAAVPDPSREEEAPDAQVQPSHKNFHLSRIRTPHQQRETSMDRSLERVMKCTGKPCQPLQP